MPVTVGAGGYFRNASGATIVGSEVAAIQAGAGATVINAGLIDPANYGVYLPDGGSFTNVGGGTVVGTDAGVLVKGAAGTIVNAGSIYATGAGSSGVALDSGGLVTNQGGGTIDGTLYGIDSSNAATVTNSGRIGVSADVGVALSRGVVTNAGTATIAGSSSGIRIFGGGTVVDAGTITGGGDAVHLYAGSTNRLVVDPGAVFGGAVDGGNALGATAVSTLELASGATAGTLTGLGTTIEHFAQITIDSGATWTLLSDTLSAGYAINDAGTLTNTGTLNSPVTLGAGAALTNAGGGLIRGSNTAAVYSSSGGAVTVTNAGSIAGNATASNAGGVYLNAGGSVTNQSSASISAYTAIYAKSGALTVVNAGKIAGSATASNAAAVDLNAGGSVTNQSAASISAFTGIYDNVSTALTLTNAGSITGNATASGGRGIDVGSGSVANQSSATISGYTGIYDKGGALTVVNFGRIAGNATSTAGKGIDLLSGGSVTNQSGATITGDTGIYGGSAAGAIVVNAGSIAGFGASSTIGSGIVLAGGGLVSNASTGTIYSAQKSGVVIKGAAGTVLNAGLITSAAGTLSGVALLDGGLVSNSSSASISAPDGAGVYITGAAGTVINYGSITGLIAPTIPRAGVVLLDGGRVTNAAGGFISSSRAGVYAGNKSVAVINGGTIAGGDAAIVLYAGGYVSNASHGTIVGSKYSGVYIKGGSGTVLNAGLIESIGTGGAGVYLAHGGLVSNSAGGVIEGGAGVVISGGAGTVVDAGTIDGGGDAVLLATGFANRVVIDPDAVFNGTVDGGNTLGATAVSKLELVSGASAGALTGFASKYIDFGHITVDAGATWSLTNNETLAPGVTLTDSGTVTLDGAVAPSEIGFAGTAAVVKLDDAAAFTGGMYGFGQGDMLNIGPGTVGSIIQQYGQNGGPPELTVLSNTGATLFSAGFSDANGNAIGNDNGTYAVSTLASGAVVAGPFELLTQNGDTVLEELPPSTWSWTGADPSNIQDPSNWTLVSGPGNQQGSPNQGDTALVNDGTLAFPPNSTLHSNTLYLTGTSEVSFVGDQANGTQGNDGDGQSGISYQNPTVDQASLITNNPTATADTTLNFAGYNVNDGRIVSDGTTGSSLTLNVTQDGTAPGYFLSYGEIEAEAGNTVTINVAGTSELFNADVIYANGGMVAINGGTGIAGGYAPMLGGIALIGAGGTLVYNAGFPAGTEGSTPVFAFYDETSGNTLLLEQLGQFSGRILGFQQGDTIDLGSALSIGTIVVTADGRLLLESAGSVDTLVLSSGAYNTGTHVVTELSAGTFTADGFTLTTGADGDTLLTTGVVDDVWNNTSGIWQTATAWSGDVAPGTTSAAIIGYSTAGADGTLTPFVLTTGSVAVDVNSLSEISIAATLQITSNTTVGGGANEYPIQQIAGEIEITNGYTLTATELKQSTPGAVLLIDAGGVLDLTGHSNLGFVNDGTLSEFTVANGSTFANGNSLAMFVQGAATVDGGAINAGPVLSGSNVVSTGGLISIGQDGGGTSASMTVENGATVTDTYAFLSSDPTSFGSLTLTGAGTTWDDASDPTDTYNTRGYMIVGDDNQSSNQPSPAPSGAAQLLVENSAVLNDYSHAEIGVSADSAGSATITSDGVWNIGTSGASGGPGGFLNVGDGGSGTLVIDNHGTVNILSGTGTFTLDGSVITSAAGMSIAHSVGGDGTVDVSGGGELNLTINPTISGSGMGVGYLGHGVLDIFNGGSVSISGGGISAGSATTVIAVGTTVAGDGTILVGGTFDSSGTIENGSTSALLVTSNGMSVGKAGTGTLYVTADGTVQVSGGGINVGNSAGAYGFAEINGGLVDDTTSGLNVGVSGTGTLELINHGTIALNGGGIDIGMSADAQGLLEIASGGMLTSTTNGMEIGVVAGASGTLDVLDGGIYNISTHGVSVGVVAGATGTILVDGAMSLINVATTDTGSGFSVGQSGTGDLTVQNGGSLFSGIGLNIGQAAGAAGTVTVTGGGTLSTSGTDRHQRWRPRRRPADDWRRPGDARGWRHGVRGGHRYRLEFLVHRHRRHGCQRHCRG